MTNDDAGALLALVRRAIGHLERTNAPGRLSVVTVTLALGCLDAAVVTLEMGMALESPGKAVEGVCALSATHGRRVA